MRAGELIRVIGALCPVHELGRLDPELVQAVLGVDRPVAAPRRLEQLEEGLALLLRFLSDRVRVLGVLLEGLILAGSEAATYGQHEQDEDHQARAGRDSAPCHEGLAVERRAPGGPAPRAAYWLVRFVEEGQDRS
jgi:hypothetical protein